MQRLLIFISVVYCQVLFAQFTVAQKDSATNLIGYGSSSYNVSIYFNASEFLDDPSSKEFKGLKESELLNKIKNAYKDATIYSQLTLMAVDKKDFTNAEKYFNQSLDNYQRWIEAEPQSAEPFIGVMATLFGSRSYSNIKNVQSEALSRFPENIKVLEWAAMIQLMVFNDFSETQNHLDKIFKTEPFNLTACAIQAQLSFAQYLTAKNNKSTDNADINISIVEKAYQARKNEIGYQALYHTMRVQREFFQTTMEWAENDPGFDFTSFPKLIKNFDKKQIEIFRAAEEFFKGMLDKDYDGRDNLLNSLGFVTFCQGKFKESKKYFQTQLNEFKKLSAIESLTLINMIEKDWTQAENNLETAIMQFSDTRSYGILLYVYEKAKKEDAKVQALLKRIEDNADLGEMRAVMLCSWHIKQKDVAKASQYLSKINPDSPEYIWRIFVISVLNDDKESAKYFLDKILTQNPTEPDALKIKKLLSL